MKIDWKKLALCLGIPLAVGGLSVLVSGGMGDYQTFVKPPLSPPGWLFPIVWTILYLVMGYASYRILTSDAEPAAKKKALTAYGVQLFLNFLWSPIFFGLRWYLVAFFELVALWVSIYITMKRFAQIEEISGDLLLPYTLWVTFAGYLNLGVYLLN